MKNSLLVLIVFCFFVGCFSPVADVRVVSGPITTFRPKVSPNDLYVLNESQLELYWTFVHRTETGFWFNTSRPAYRLMPREHSRVTPIGSGVHYIAVSIPADVSGGFEYLYTLEILVSPRTEPVLYKNVQYPNVSVIDFVPREVEIDGVRVQRVVEWGQYLVRRGIRRPLDALLLNTLGRAAK